MRDLMGELSRHKDHLLTVETKERDYVAQVSRSKTTITCLERQLRKLEKNLIKQQRAMNKQANLPKITFRLNLLQSNYLYSLDLVHQYMC